MGQESRVLRCAVLLNAAAALYVSGNGWTLDEATQRATNALDGRAAAQVLARLRKGAARQKT
jgi:anthranilate phosphoribosyltransferase